MFEIFRRCLSPRFNSSNLPAKGHPHHSRRTSVLSDSQSIHRFCEEHTWWGYCAWDSLAKATIHLRPYQQKTVSSICTKTQSETTGDPLLLEVSTSGVLSRHKLVVYFSVLPMVRCPSHVLDNSLIHENDDIQA